MKAGTTLTVRLVRRYIADPARVRYFEEYDNHSVDVRPATRITPAAAACLADNVGGFLNLDEITELTPASARALACFDGELCLNGLRKLPRASAVALARHKGELWLNGLPRISVPVAVALADHQGALYLNGLTSLSPKAAAAMAKRKGWRLSLGSLKKTASPTKSSPKA